MIRLSVIIPIYNGLACGLKRCLESVVAQATPEVEVIAVDDCSTDDTPQFLAEYAAQHPAVQHLTTPHNLRQGGARNHGLRHARGQYIALLDQDDYYHPGSVQEILKRLAQEPQLDVLVVEAAYERPGHPSNEMQSTYRLTSVMTGDELIGSNTIPYAPWRFVFSLRLIADHQLYFIENERIEDVDWVHRMVHYARAAQYLPILLVHYQKHQRSTTMTALRNPSVAFSALHMCRRLKLLYDNEFQGSPATVHTYFPWVVSSQYDEALRRMKYFFSRQKAAEIRQYAPHVRRPRLFQWRTNLLCPIYIAALWIYRHLRYKEPS